MEDKILGFQFELVPTKPTHPSYNDGSNQDEPQKQPPEVFCKKGALKTHCKSPVPESLFQKTLLKKRLWHRILWNFYEHLFYKTYLGDCFWILKPNIKDWVLKNSTTVKTECMWCHKILKAKAINLKGKTRFSWNIADLEFTEAVVPRCFSKWVFLKILQYSQKSTSLFFNKSLFFYKVF